ncbi:MAG: putative toxin-antitoxin system toxin component, PIN family [Burkholderiales bacterium]
MLRAVADTNVVVSALLWRGAPHRLFGRIEPERIELYSSRALLAELEDVLARRKLARAVRATGKTVPALLSEYRALVRLVTPRVLATPAARDPDDDAVIACALAARAQLIVSGDKDLRALRAFGAIRIVSPAEALQLVG